MGDFHHAPIKRNQALIPLSRDHFTALVRAQRLVKAAKKDRVTKQKSLAAFLDAWIAEIADHFDDEERLFLPYLAQESRQRLLREHADIRALAEEAKQLRKTVDPSPERLTIIGQTLIDHIRWEERELFTQLENTLTNEQLQAIAHQTEHIEAKRHRTLNYGAPHGEELL